MFIAFQKKILKHFQRFPRRYTNLVLIHSLSVTFHQCINVSQYSWRCDTGNLFISVHDKNLILMLCLFAKTFIRSSSKLYLTRNIRRAEIIRIVYIKTDSQTHEIISWLEDVNSLKLLNEHRKVQWYKVPPVGHRPRINPFQWYHLGFFSWYP